TTFDGGTGGNGTVFKISSDGSLATLHNFGNVDGAYPYGNSNGAHPLGGLVQGSDGFLYGTTSQGGTNGNGTVFKMTSDGSLTTLHTFGPFPAYDGRAPYARLVQGSDGNFYGTTYIGGLGGSGTVFKITSDG